MKIFKLFSFFIVVVFFVSINTFSYAQDFKRLSAEDLKAKTQKLFDEAKFPDIESKVLDNGLTVVVLPKKNYNSVTQMLWYKVGAADEDPGLSGLAHFFEHLMFRGSKKYEDGYLDKRLHEIGGSNNAFTYYDYTAYYEVFAPQYLGEMMEFEADRMINLNLVPEVVEPERKVVLEERSLRVENNPDSTIFLEMMNTLFKNNHYSIPTIGWRKEIENVTIEQLNSFYRKYYNPSNVILIVAGGVNSKDVFKLAEENFGGIKVDKKANKKANKRVRYYEPVSTGSTVSVKLASPNVKVKKYIRMSYIAPENRDIASDKMEGGSSITYSGDIAADYLGNISGPLYKYFITDNKLATEISFDTYSLGWVDVCYLEAYPAEGKSFEDFEKGIDKFANELLDGDLDETRIERLKYNAVYSELSYTDDYNKLARKYGLSLVLNTPVKDLTNTALNFKNVKVNDVKKFLKTCFKNSATVFGYLIPKKSEKIGNKQQVSKKNDKKK